MPTRILIVDDEPSVCDLLAYNLRQAHYEVLVAADGRQALELARESAPDLILLDLMLPEIDGLDVCRELRKTSDVPIIMITARGEETDRVVGLELGADDYVCKPFSVRELLARVKAVLRRPRTPGENHHTSAILQSANGLGLDPDSRSATLNGVHLDLTRLEFDLLQYLHANAGRVLSREQLLEQAWGYSFAGSTRAVDSTIKRLRAKLRASLQTTSSDPSGGPQDELIEAVRGIGYRLVR